MKNLYHVRNGIVGGIRRTIKGSGLWMLRPGSKVATKTGHQIQKRLAHPGFNGSGVHIQNLSIPTPRGMRRSNIRMN